MKIIFENIGIVKRIEIDLSKSLTIFCGPNNTGKTYLAYCIYALNSLMYSDIASPNYGYITALSDIDENFSIDIHRVFCDIKNKFIKKIQSEFINQLSTVFGLDGESTHRIFADSRISIIIEDEEFRYRLSNTTHQSEIKLDTGRTIALKKCEQSTELQVISSNSHNNVDNNLKSINEYINIAIYDLIFKSIFDSAFMATVERNSIFTFSKELSLQRNSLIDDMLNISSKHNKTNSNPLDLLARRAKRYPLAIRDSLEISEDLNNLKKFNSEYSFIADILENGLLNGKLSVSKDGELDYSPNNSKKVKIPLHISASIVKSLSSIVLYFRHFSQKGDLIIIDEPELNLHPDSQILLAKVFGIMINSGFKLIINTHSDYIIREINNLIMLDKYKDKKLLKQYNYSEKEIINPSNTSAYLFNPISNNGVEIEYLEVSEDGFEVETIDSVINDLNIRSQELYYKLHEK